MTTLNSFLKTKGWKEQTLYREGKRLHVLQTIHPDIAHGQIDETIIYNPLSKNPPLYLNEEVILIQLDNYKEIITKTETSFYKALRKVYPKGFSCRLFLGHPKFYYKNAVNNNPDLSALHDTIGEGERLIIWEDHPEFGDLFYTERDYHGSQKTEYNVLITNYEKSFDTPEEAEDFLFMDHVVPNNMENCKSIRYMPQKKQYFCFWGEGYTNQSPSLYNKTSCGEKYVTIGFFNDINGFSPAEQQAISNLHYGEAITFSDAPVPQYMSVVRVF